MTRDRRERIEVAEVDLIEFFCVLPEPRSQEDIDMFETPVFVKRVDGLVLRFSLSMLDFDLGLELYVPGQEAPVLRLHLDEVSTLRIERSGGRPWLRASSWTNGSFELAVEPTIEVRWEEDRSPRMQGY